MTTLTIDAEIEEVQKCDFCESKENVTYEADPFLSEVYNEDSYGYYCESCYVSRHCDV